MDGLTARAVGAAAFLLMAVAAAGCVWLQRRTVREQRLEGLVWLQALRALIMHLQRHRGLSSGVKSGELILQSQLEEVQRQISIDFGDINNLGDWIRQHELWQHITQHWARLARNVRTLSVTRSINQHNRLIQSVLQLIDEAAYRFHIQAHGGRFAWRDLLCLAEDLGHVRALGTAMAANAGKSVFADTAAAKVSLRLSIKAASRSLELPSCSARLDAAACRSLTDFLAYTESRLLHDQQQIAAADFYRIATAAVEVVYNRFDTEIMAMTQRLRS